MPRLAAGKSPFFPFYNNMLIIHNGKRLVKEKIDEILPVFSSFLSKGLPCHQIYDKLERNPRLFCVCARKKFWAQDERGAFFA